jgi:hypothetical protein
MLIKSINLANARLMDFYQAMSLTSGFLQKEDTAALNLADAANGFTASFAALDTAVKQAQKTGYTDAIIAADDKRDNILIGFTGVLNGYTRFPEPELANAATQLLAVTDKYGPGVARLPQREETAVLTNLVGDLRNEVNAPLLQTVGVAVWVDKLDEANLAFGELYANRTEKEAAYITGLTRTERANTQAAFEKLAQAIEAWAFINGEAAYKPLADKINQAVADVQQAARARATQAANKKASPDAEGAK